MVIFSSGYYHPMDRGYEVINLDKAPDETPLEGTPLKKIGTSVGYGKDALQNLKAAIFEGASVAEIGFTAKNKGWKEQGQTTPESYSKEERDAMRELAKANEVELKTHATIGMTGFSGLSEGAGGNQFSDDEREKTLFEIRRAIDFAADTAGGGSVVVHAGEFPRSLLQARKKYGGKFKGFEGEEDQQTIYFADPDTGRVEAISTKEKVLEPVVTDWKIDQDGRRVPEKYEYDSQGSIKMAEKSYDQVVEEERKLNPGSKLTDEILFYRRVATARLLHSRGEALRTSDNAREITTEIEKVNQALEFYEKVEKATSEEDKWKLKEAIPDRLSQFVPPEVKTPAEYLRKRLKELENDKRGLQEVATHYAMQYTQEQNKAERIKPIEQVAVEKSADTIARAGMYAFDVEKKKKCEKPIFVSPENWFPDAYGGHPQEMKELILKAREKMTQILVENKKMSETDAKKIAESHIKATFDIGHAHTWKKYFQGSDEDYNKWLINEVKDLNKHKIIGHIHVTDNFGYYDEHLVPGQGTAPIKEFLEEMKKAGVDAAIVEGPIPWRDAIQSAAAEHTNPIYGLTAKGKKRFVDIDMGYGAKRNVPYHSLYQALPTQENKPWTETPME